MLLTKTFCKAGSLVYIVPTGLLVTLHYDVHGALCDISKGFNGNESLGEDFIRAVSGTSVPYNIPIHGGTTDMWAVFYSNKFTATYCSILPESEDNRIISDILSGNVSYSLYVGKVSSGAASLINPTSMNTWLNVNGFKALPTWLVPMNADDYELCKHMNSSRNIAFVYPHISGFICYQDGGEPFFRRCNLNEATVSKTHMYVDDAGYIMYQVEYAIDDEQYASMTMHYSEAVRYNIKKGSQIIWDTDTVLWSNTQTTTGNKRLSNTVACTSCGKKLSVPSAGPMACTDAHCLSVMYPRVQRFCDILHIECIAKSTLDKHIKSGDFRILPDLLLLPTYRKMTISATLSDILFATISGDVGMSKDWITKLCSVCNNNYQTVKYYLENPVQMYTELDIQPSSRFKAWLADPQNLLELNTIVNSEQIEFPTGDKVTKFDGPQLFRNKTICITGTFMHGTTEDVEAILNSYGATVVTEFDEFVQCVIVGDVRENISGVAVQGARAFGIPLFDESDFFAKYQIDEDLEKSLS